MSVTKIYIVKIGFCESLIDYTIIDHKAFFSKEEAETERDHVNKTYSNPPECPLPEGEDEYYDRLRIDLTSPDEDTAMGEWEEFMAKIEDFDEAFIRELNVY